MKTDPRAILANPPDQLSAQQKILLLESIDFSWVPQGDRWWSRFHQLEAFYEEHGHFNVQGRENHQLRCWKNTLRRQCREYVQAVALEQQKNAGSMATVHVSGLNPERLEALRRIRFCWLPSPDTADMEQAPGDIFYGYH